MLQKNAFGQKKKNNFMHEFKSAILATFQFFQNGTFEPVHEIWIFFGQKNFFEALWKWQDIICPKVRQIDLCRKKYKKGIF